MYSHTFLGVNICCEKFQCLIMKHCSRYVILDDKSFLKVAYELSF